MTFGPGGSDCRAPVAKFTVNGKSEAEVTVGKGETVTFDASGSEMLGATPSELDWNFGDGSEEKVKEAAEEPAQTSITHKFLSGGTYTVTLRMKLAHSDDSPTGNPLPVTRAVKVPGSGSMFKLTVAQDRHGLGGRDQLSGRDRLRQRLRSGIRIGQRSHADRHIRHRLQIHRLVGEWLLGHGNLQSDDERSEGGQRDLRSRFPSSNSPSPSPERAWAP